MQGDVLVLHVGVVGGLLQGCLRVADGGLGRALPQEVGQLGAQPRVALLGKCHAFCKECERAHAATFTRATRPVECRPRRNRKSVICMSYAARESGADLFPVWRIIPIIHSPS